MVEHVRRTRQGKALWRLLHDDGERERYLRTDQVIKFDREHGGKTAPPIAWQHRETFEDRVQRVGERPCMRVLGMRLPELHTSEPDDIGWRWWDQVRADESLTREPLLTAQALSQFARGGVVRVGGRDLAEAVDHADSAGHTRAPVQRGLRALIDRGHVEVENPDAPRNQRRVHLLLLHETPDEAAA